MSYVLCGMCYVLCVMWYVELLIPHTSYLIPHTSYLIPHTSYLIPHSSFLVLKPTTAPVSAPVFAVQISAHTHPPQRFCRAADWMNHSMTSASIPVCRKTVYPP